MTNPYAGLADEMEGGDFLDVHSLAPVLGRHALIDGDMVLYAAAFAAQGKDFEVATFAARRRINETLQNAQASGHTLFLSGTTNFRQELATSFVYKGNRASRERPDWYEDLRQFLLDEMGAVECDGIEADDALATRQHSSNMRHIMAELHADPGGKDHTIICTGDKDLNAVAGWHYDTLKGVLWFADKYGRVTLSEGTNKKLRGEGMMYFLAQMLTGDATDNIPGAPAPSAELAKKYGFRRGKGIGPVAAYTMLSKCGEGSLDAARDAYRIVREAYCNDDERLIEMGRMLWMRHHFNEMWEPATIGTILKELK